jgi:hypothetical protein
MARKPKIQEDAEDTAWPVIDSYTTKDGLLVKVYQAAWAVAGSNPFDVRPKRFIV